MLPIYSSKQDIFSIDLHELEKQLNALSIQERLNIDDPNVLDPIMRINQFVRKTKVPIQRQVTQVQVQQSVEAVLVQEKDATVLPQEEDELDAVLSMSEAIPVQQAPAVIAHQVTQPVVKKEEENLEAWLDDIL